MAFVDVEAKSKSKATDEKPDSISESNSTQNNNTSKAFNVCRPSKLWHLFTRKSNIDGPIDTNPPPDGGIKAWTVVAMCHLAGFNTWGFLNSFGVLQSYYVAHLDRLPSEISWIGSVQAFMLFFISAFSGRLSDAGYFHQTLSIGTMLQLLGVFSASFGNNYWQLALSQGACVGIGGWVGVRPCAESGWDVFLETSESGFVHLCLRKFGRWVVLCRDIAECASKTRARLGVESHWICVCGDDGTREFLVEAQEDQEVERTNC